MAGESFSQLVSLGHARDGKSKTSIEGVGLNQAISEAMAVDEVAGKKRRLVNKGEQATTAQYEARVAREKQMVAKYGTDDPEKIAQLEATGALANDLPMRMKLDPEGTRQAVDRAVAISGKGGTQGLVPREFREGVGKAGERYFTNLSDAELSQQGNGPSGMDIQEPVTGLHTIDPANMGGGGNVGGESGTSPEQTIFEGKLARAQGIAEKPERDIKRLKAREEYGQSIIDYSLEHGAMSGLDKIKKDLMDGDLGAMGLQPEDAAKIEAMIVKRAKTVSEMAQKPGLPKEFKIPWTKSGDKPGMAADVAEPSTILNPGGGPSVMTQEAQRKTLADSESMDIMEQSMPGEIPRTAHYAKGGKAPKTRPTPIPGGQSPTPMGASARPNPTVPNPIDEFMRMMTPNPSLSPEESLRRKARDPFMFGG